MLILSLQLRNDIELKVDYNKDDDFIGFYGHKGIRNIGFS